MQPQYTTDPAPLKRCTICGQEFPATTEHFYRRKEAKDGLRTECRECLEKRNRKWQENNPDRVRANARNRKARQRQRSRDTMLQRTREWKAKNPDKIRAYRDANRTTFALYARRRRDRIDGRPDTLTPEQWQFALDYFKGCCAVCGRPLNGLFHTPAVDHWIPVSHPDCPGTVVTNIIPLCAGIGGCNNRKGSNDPETWLVTTFGAKRAHKILARIRTYFKTVTSGD